MNLRKKSENADTITLEWDAVAGATGYRFSSSLTNRRSHTWDATRTDVKFSKGAEWYKVEALGVVDADTWPDTTPPVGTLVLAGRDDLTGSVNGQGISDIAGGGFKVVCDTNHPPGWDSSSKAVLGQNYYSPEKDAIGKAERWEYDLYLPTQSLISGWTVGMLWQWHTKKDGGGFPSSGHQLAVNTDGTFRIVRQSGPGTQYDWPVGGGSGGPPIKWNQWMPVKWEVRWSYDGDGFLRLWLDGQQRLAYSGATLFDNEFPYLQFGWYSSRQLSNEVRFSTITMTRF
jgi:hypothetical protein